MSVNDETGPHTHTHHDFDYERPILQRYLDPIELIWLSTAKRLGLVVRRHPEVFAMTEGDGILHLGPRSSLDPDDSILQMVFHEICHWITNGEETAQERDWGFRLDGELDPREHACQRLQATLAQRYGLRDMLGATGDFRQYWDRLGADTLAPLDDSPWEAEVLRHTKAALARADREPFQQPLADALKATASIRTHLQPFLANYSTEIPDDSLPSMWAFNDGKSTDPNETP